MKKGKHLAGAAFLAVILFCLPVGKTSAYMTDSASLLNQMTPGNNTSRIVEDFPPVSPQNPEDDPVFQKTVQITAPAASGQNVDCYVRARILYSNSDIGNTVTLSGTDPAWIKGNDGYYYYTHKLREGETTAPLFTSLAIDSTKQNDRSKAYVKNFEVSIYEESVQAGSAQNYSAAWAAFRH